MSDLQTALDYWKGVLGLSHWRITAEWVPALGDRTRHGETSTSFTCESARIHMIRPDNADGGGSVEYDPEATLVHELLHCVTAARQYNNWQGAEDSIHEQVIERIAQSMVRLHRVFPAGLKM